MKPAASSYFSRITADISFDPWLSSCKEENIVSKSQLNDEGLGSLDIVALAVGCLLLNSRVYSCNEDFIRRSLKHHHELGKVIPFEVSLNVISLPASIDDQFFIADILDCSLFQSSNFLLGTPTQTRPAQGASSHVMLVERHSQLPVHVYCYIPRLETIEVLIVTPRRCPEPHAYRLLSVSGAIPANRLFL